jgi:BirA family biotin operon repressor/biotin-[acetyl-CoA-carboxylase] ligase
MRAKVLVLLKERHPEYISGEEISRILGVSRTAVWKHIKQLKEGGYQIEAHTKVGYRLIQVTGKLSEYELADLLQGCVVGQNIVLCESVGSTNELAKELAQKGAQEGTVVIAEEQTAGKGRMGRTWYSPDGQGLWFSIILRPHISPVDASKTTLVSAVAVAKAIRDIAKVPAGIKWPNDILIGTEKVCGILTEMNAEIDKVNYLIIGIGINMNLDKTQIPYELVGLATSLAEQKDGGVSRLKLLAEVLRNFDKLYKEFIAGEFSPILKAWKEMSVTLNRWVKVSAVNMQDEGIAFDLDEEGALLLMKKDGSLKRILSGEVSLR